MLGDMRMQGNIESGSTTQRKQGRLKGFLISSFIFAVWISGLYWLFLRYMSENYFIWFIENGTLISLATSFLALVWQGLEEQKGLLSWHPGEFLRSCFTLMAVFFSAMAANLAGPLDGVKRRAYEAQCIFCVDMDKCPLSGVKRRAGEPISIGETLWDTVFAVMMHLIMGLAVLGWLLVIAPLFYLVTLFTGAPARRAIRDTGIRAIVKGEGSTIAIAEQPSSAAISNGWIDVSLGVRPFALTNALNAVVLFLAKMLI